MIATLAAFAAIGATMFVMAWAVGRLAARAARPMVRKAAWTVAIACALAGVPFVALAGYMGVFLAMGQPGPEARRLGKGAEYRREVFPDPRPIVVHVLEVDLSAGSRIVVSPPSDAPWIAATTGLTALERLGADAAINASFFYPFRESHPLSYQPREGERVRTVGISIGVGERYGLARPGMVSFWSTPHRRVGFGEPPGSADASVSGIGWLVREGREVVQEPDAPYPRTALGLDRSRDRLWLVVVDGKQPRYSEGMTLRELPRFLVRLGVDDAIQLDGGGSSTMVARDGAGDAVLLNRPCHTKVPGRQRPVANFLGVIFPR